MRAVRVNIGQILRNQQREGGQEGGAQLHGMSYNAGGGGQIQGQGAGQQGAGCISAGGAAGGVPTNQNDDFQMGTDPQMMFQA